MAHGFTRFHPWSLDFVAFEPVSRQRSWRKCIVEEVAHLMLVRKRKREEGARSQ